MSCANKVLVVTHVGKSGGAGIYISDFLNHLSSYLTVDVTGKGSCDYTLDTPPVSTFFGERNFFFPNYRGTSSKHRFYWGVQLFTDLFALLFNFRKLKEFVKKYEYIVVTSSIQVFIAPVLRVIGYKGKTVCLIQENLAFEGFSGFLVRHALCRFDHVFSITESWSAYAKSYSVDTIFLPNTFSRPDFDVSDNLNYYDILYVGGSSKLKGFRTLLKVFQSLAERRRLRLCMLGSYDAAAEKEIEQLSGEFEPKGSKIELVGRTDEVYKYLGLSSVLVMPIEESHFCRPAVEAGFCHRTFVVPRLEGLDDFAKDNVNCLMYEPKSVDDLARKIEILLTDVVFRKEMEVANYELASSKFSSDKYFDELKKIFRFI